MASKHISALLLAALLSSTAFSQCANNNTVIAGAAITPPCPGSMTVPCVQGGQYALVNVVSGNTYTFSTCGAAFDTEITLRQQPGGTVMGYNDDNIACGLFSLQSSVTWLATYTGLLRVLVDLFPCSDNTTCAPLTIACSAPPPPVTNNDPCGSIALPVNSSCVMQGFTSVGSTITVTPGSPGCGVVSGGDVWFSFVAPASGLVVVETGAGTLTDAILAVYSATTCSTGFTEVACDDDSGPGLMPYLSASGLTPGATYYARVFGFLGTTGSFDICLHTIVPPTGDCIYTLNMFDSFGDGWDGSTVGVSINGGPFTNYTLTSGTNGTALIGVFIGDIIVIQYTENSFFPAEISYSLTPGCIWSDGPSPATGIVFSQTADCQPTAAPPEDCVGAVTICSDLAFNNNTTSTGCSADLDVGNQGCLSNAERQGTWYFFSPSSSGNIAMTISPADPADDYDFAIWGPFANPVCPPPGAPTRCSYAAPTGDTGMDYVAADVSETALGDKWVSDLAVVTGQVYIMYISNWSQSGLAFDLNWDLTNGASLDCTVLPIQLLHFEADALTSRVDLRWASASEQDNDHFVVERSADGDAFAPIGAVDAAGTTTMQTNYLHTDASPLRGMNYYRLKQVDTNGSYTYSSTIAVAFGSVFQTGLPYPNPALVAVSIDLHSSVPGTTRVRAVDATGRLVAERSFDLGTGAATLDLPLTGCEAGAYALQVIAPDGSCLRAGRFTVQ
ncbi:MAG: hypothetical protein ABI599_12830 [Flavobacteriales bacterium]